MLTFIAYYTFSVAITDRRVRWSTSAKISYRTFFGLCALGVLILDNNDSIRYPGARFTLYRWFQKCIPSHRDLQFNLFFNLKKLFEPTTESFSGKKKQGANRPSWRPLRFQTELSVINMLRKHIVKISLTRKIKNPNF